MFFTIFYLFLSRSDNCAFKIYSSLLNQSLQKMFLNFLSMIFGYGFYLFLFDLYFLLLFVQPILRYVCNKNLVCLSEKCMRNASFSCSTSPPNTMHIIFSSERKTVIDYILDIWYIQAPCCNVCSNLSQHNRMNRNR